MGLQAARIPAWLRLLWAIGPVKPAAASTLSEGSKEWTVSARLDKAALGHGPGQVCLFKYDDPCVVFPTLYFDVAVDSFFMVRRCINVQDRACVRARAGEDGVGGGEGGG